MGRNRIRNDDENKVYDKIYQREYQKARQQSEAEYYKTSASRSYYRKVLRNLDPNDKRYEKVSRKVNELDIKVNELINARNRYGRLDIIEKVNAKISCPKISND